MAQRKNLTRSTRLALRSKSRAYQPIRSGDGPDDLGRTRPVGPCQTRLSAVMHPDVCCPIEPASANCDPRGIARHRARHHGLGGEPRNDVERSFQLAACLAFAHTAVRRDRLAGQPIGPWFYALAFENGPGGGERLRVSGRPRSSCTPWSPR